MGTPNTTAEETAIASAAVGPNVLRVGDSSICSGIEPMSIPSGSPHVRQVAILLPVQFVGRPAVTAVVHARADQPAAAGAMFPIFNIGDVAVGTTHTQIKISAQNSNAGQPLNDIFECEYVVIGRAKT